MSYEKEALRYHKEPRPGKIEVVPSKPCLSQSVLIFPNLASGNAAYKLLERLGGAKAVGPLLMGISKPFNVLQRGTDMENVVDVIAITVVQAQDLGRKDDEKALLS